MESAPRLDRFPSQQLFANRTVSGLDENEVREEEEEGLSDWGTTVVDAVQKEVVNSSVGWDSDNRGVGGSIVIPSYMKSEESSFESGSGVTP